MDFRFTKEQLARKEEFSVFFKEIMKQAPHEYLEGILEKEFGSKEALEFYRVYLKELGKKGWNAMAWPKEYGGLALSDTEQILFLMATEEYGAPSIEQIGVGIFAPGVMQYGSEEQKKELLSPIAKGEVIYCQGWSEPDAGSDLANLSTVAIRNGDEYIVNGSKIWTSAGHVADKMYLLARTDPNSKRSRGISAFHLDMKTPGIEVRPLYYMEGSHLFNEVFFKDVRIPATNLIGKEGQGWEIANASANSERSGFFMYSFGKTMLEQIIAYAKKAKRNGIYISEDPVIRRRIVKLYAEIQCGINLGFKIAWMVEKYGHAKLPPNLPSESKTFGSELFQRITTLGTEVMGMYGAVAASDWVPIRGVVEQYQFAGAQTIAMGSNEVQRNLIAWFGLRLPRLKTSV